VIWTVARLLQKNWQPVAANIAGFPTVVKRIETTNPASPISGREQGEALP